MWTVAIIGIKASLSVNFSTYLQELILGTILSNLTLEFSDYCSLDISTDILLLVLLSKCTFCSLTVTKAVFLLIILFWLLPSFLSRYLISGLTEPHRCWKQYDWCSSMGRVCGGVGCQRPLWFPHHCHTGSHTPLHCQRTAVLETSQDDWGTWPGAEEKAETAGKHSQG